MIRPVLVLVAAFALVACDHDSALPGGGGAGTGGNGATGGNGTGTGGNGGTGGSGGAVDGGVPGLPAAPDGGCVLGPSGALGAIPAATMAPGTACLACHLVAKGGFLYIAGTVYTDWHEPDLCLGRTDVKVQITDANGTQHLLDVNSSGNFLDDSLLELWPSPWTVAVLRGGASRAMVGTVTSGDCNSCHTAAGANGAPGRILPPDPAGQ